MDVFLSWSGPRSRAVAEAFARWLPKLIQAVDPWISTDIEKGERWSREIRDRLEKTRFGIFCLTSDNRGSPWLHFEAGAISKTSGSRACTFLLDVKSEDVKPPLGQFQNTRFEKADLFKLVLDINESAAAGGDKVPSKDNLSEGFELLWPSFEKELSAIPAKTLEKLGRTDSDKLDELLSVVRGMARKLDEAGGAGAASAALSKGTYILPSETGTFTGKLPQVSVRLSSEDIRAARERVIASMLETKSKPESFYVNIPSEWLTRKKDTEGDPPAGNDEDGKEK